MYGNSDFDWHEDENNQIRARAEVYREEQQEETIRKLKAKVALLEKALAEQPAQRTWVGLTDEEFENAWSQSKGDVLFRIKPFALAVEAKLKEKNNG